MPWIINVWIPAEIKDPQRYDSKELAEKDIESMKMNSPENVYEAVEVEAEPEKIIITMDGGLIQEIEGIPPGITIEVRDFDTEGSEDDRIVEIDGERAFVTIWEGCKDGIVIKDVR